jgi:hypothetical protein
MLADRLLEDAFDVHPKLCGVAGRQLLLVIGEESALPWCDGAAYLGLDPEVPSLLLPTTHGPTVPLALLERALLARFPTAAIPLAVLPDLLIPTGIARPLTRRALEQWRR